MFLVYRHNWYMFFWVVLFMIYLIPNCSSLRFCCYGNRVERGYDTTLPCGVFNHGFLDNSPAHIYIHIYRSMMFPGTIFWIFHITCFPYFPMILQTLFSHPFSWDFLTTGLKTLEGTGWCPPVYKLVYNPVPLSLGSSERGLILPWYTPQMAICRKMRKTKIQRYQFSDKPRYISYIPQKP